MVLTAAEYERKAHVFGEVIHVRVGPVASYHRRINIHKALATQESDFFKTALDPKWDTNRHGVVDLTDEPFDYFQIFAHWLYRNEICLRYTTDESVTALISSYLLGQKLLAPRFCDDVLTSLARISCASCFPLTPFHSNQVFDQTSPSSPLRRVLADVLAWQSTNGSALETGHPDELYSETSQTFIARRSRQSASDGTIKCTCADAGSFSSLHSASADLVAESHWQQESGRFLVAKMAIGPDRSVLYGNRKVALERSLFLGDSGYSHLHILPSAFKVYLQQHYLGWDYQDIIEHACEANQLNSPEMVFPFLVDLYYVGSAMEQSKLCNASIDAVMKWIEKTRVMPTESLVEHAYDLIKGGDIAKFSLAKDVTAIGGYKLITYDKLLLLLTTLYAWNIIPVTTTHLIFLNTLAAVSRAMLDAIFNCRKEELVAPFDEGQICRNFYKGCSTVCARRKSLTKLPVDSSEQIWDGSLKSLFQRRISGGTDRDIKLQHLARKLRVAMPLALRPGSPTTT